ncbi:expressed unknown protein [Seminavis robusta]|uniref:Uncharacterized protein n=1 Tax=Seminavis robusta TaxID=568900 RepID=A0A9N8E3E8_9STRA|nr:expressed unknown protein [Seminavis robusta]|eukprot:Sro504_g156050.1 n/a (372) ;mRNA; f:48685-49800
MMIVKQKMATLVVTGLMAVNVATAWLSRSSPTVIGGSLRPKTTALFYRDLPEEAEEPILPVSIRRRASLEGVSLAPTGFWVMLRIAQDGYLPWQVTDDPQDAYAATSAEALTMIQLLSGVDMAGAILPPDVLAKLVIHHCESLVAQQQSPMFFAKQVAIAKDILDYVQETLPNSTVAFSQVHQWTQSRVQLPEATLDEVLVTDNTQAPFALTCTLRDFGSLTFTPSLQSLQAVLYQFSPQTSLAFTALALALRYRAPITVQSKEKLPLTLQGIQQKFPMYAAKSTLQQSSNRVQQNIVRGFEIHKLSGALKIALEKGDHAAAAKIRKALDEYDSMDELPTAELQEDGLVEQPQDLNDDGLQQNNMTMSVFQ